MLDLSERDLALIQKILKQFVPNTEVRAFGSRVKGNAKKYSDIDLAILAETPLTLHTLGDLLEAFQESDLLFRVDIVDWNRISDSFKEVISQHYELVQSGG